MIATVKELLGKSSELSGQRVTVRGLVKSNRDNRAVGFLQVNDGSVFDSVQVVYDPQVLTEAAHLRTGAQVICEGVLVLTPENKQPFEVRADSIEIAGGIAEDYPLQKKRTSYEHLRTMPHLRQRTNTFGAVFRVRSELSFAIHEYFHERGFFYIHTPIFTGNDCEGAGQAFTAVVDPRKPDEFFGKRATLTVSGQLHVEPFALTYQKVYTFGPTFRAEKSNTLRHAAEFWMIEPEVAFCDLAGDMDLMEDFLKTVTARVVERCPSDFEFFRTWVCKDLQQRLDTMLKKPFKRVSYTEGIEILKKAKEDGYQFVNSDIEWGMDLGSEHERYLTEKHFGCPIFLYDYPKDIKAFYMKNNPDGKTVAAADLLFPDVGELCGGSQREEDYDTLLDRIRELGMSEESYRWYLDSRRWGGSVHSGFGLGFDRLLMYITGLENIRDVQPYPRTYGDMEF